MSAYGLKRRPVFTSAGYARICAICEERPVAPQRTRCHACKMYKYNHGIERPKGLTPRHYVKRGPAHYAWKGDAAGTQTKRDRARRAYALGLCERCGDTASDRHHKDGDTGNNAPENIQLLCRRCHMEVDGRLAAFMALPKTPKQAAKPCSVCDQPYKPLRKGLCARCYSARRRNARSVTHG